MEGDIGELEQDLVKQERGLSLLMKDKLKLEDDISHLLIFLQPIFNTMQIGLHSFYIFFQLDSFKFPINLSLF
jgi:hypothetical protein